MGPQRAATLAGAPLERSRHVCAFFHTPEEHYRVLLPFIKEGMERCEKAFHVVDPSLRPEHLSRLRESGVDVEAAEQSRQLEVRIWENIHLRGGCFDTDAMLVLIQDVLTRGKTEGFPMTRFVANMEWALEDCPGVHQLVEYEARLNNILPDYDDPVICTYDLTRFGGDTVMDILRTHPLVIVGGILQENPFYVLPQEFLRELRARRSELQAGA